MKRIALVVLLLSALMVGMLPTAWADSGITITANTFTNQFPVSATFRITGTSPALLKSVALTVKVNGDIPASRFLPQFDAVTAFTISYDWSFEKAYLPPGTTGTFTWHLEDSAGNVQDTPPQAFRVEDPRFQWKQAGNEQLVVYWYKGDQAFGEAIYQRGVEAMKFLGEDTGVKPDRRVQIWIYGSRADFFQALGTGAKEWTGGITLPEFSTVLIDVPPEDLEWGKGATTHELAHVIVHQQLKSPLGDLAMPHWIDEGLAVYYETIPGTLDAQFDRPLKRAIQNNTLAPIRSFSGNFPTDSSAANLAYAESYSMVDFILRHFGRDKLRALFEQFKQGRAYDDAFMQVFGVDTDGLENLWRKDIGAPERVITARPTETPGAFPTFSLSTDTTPAATTATATPEAAAVVPTSARPVATPPIGPATPSPGLCGGVFGLMGLMALGVWRRRNGHRSQ